MTVCTINMHVETHLFGYADVVFYQDAYPVPWSVVSQIILMLVDLNIDAKIGGKYIEVKCDTIMSVGEKMRLTKLPKSRFPRQALVNQTALQPASSAYVKCQLYSFFIFG